MTDKEMLDWLDLNDIETPTEDCVYPIGGIELRDGQPWQIQMVEGRPYIGVVWRRLAWREAIQAQPANLEAPLVVTGAFTLPGPNRHLTVTTEAELLSVIRTQLARSPVDEVRVMTVQRAGSGTSCVSRSE